MKLSIVATLYNSAPYLKEFCERSAKVAKQLVEDSYEIVLVNDGSPDNSVDLAVEMAGKDKHIVVVDLSRNFGHHRAIMAGLAQARGEQIFLIDSDLEEEPEWLLDFDKDLREQKCDMVFGVQGSRKGGFFERISGACFYSMFNTFTGMRLPRNLVTARLMTRRFVSALLMHREREICLAGLLQITGFEQVQREIVKNDHSPTTYSLTRKLSALVNAVTSFSAAPLKGIFLLGLGISSFAFAFVGFLVVRWFFFAKAAEGWTSVIASVWLLGGLIIMFIGVVGIYLAKVYSESKQRPFVIVKEVHGGEQDG